MSEQFLDFSCVFNNPTIYIIECISWTIKHLIGVLKYWAFEVLKNPILNRITINMGMKVYNPLFWSYVHQQAEFVIFKQNMAAIKGREK